MKIMWVWIVVAVLLVAAYKAGQMSVAEEFSIYGTPASGGGMRGPVIMIIVVVVALIIWLIGYFLYTGVIAPAGYVIHRAGHSMYNGIIKR